MQDNEEWINWTGGKQPVPDDIRVEVKYSGGCDYPHWVKQGSKAIDFTWSHGWGISDIIAYRIINQELASSIQHKQCREMITEYVVTNAGLVQELTQAQQKLAVAVEALEKIERTIPIETPNKLGLSLVKICKITLEALAVIKQPNVPI